MLNCAQNVPKKKKERIVERRTFFFTSFLPSRFEVIHESCNFIIIIKHSSFDHLQEFLSSSSSTSFRKIFISKEFEKSFFILCAAAAVDD